VVDGEIKALANQTQQATQQIKERILAIQGATDGTVKEVGLITGDIAEVNAVEMNMSGRSSHMKQSAGGLADYTSYHFGLEASLFACYRYPASAERRTTHRQLVEKVTAFRRDVEEGRAGLSMDLMDFLSDWLRQHIMKTDVA